MLVQMSWGLDDPKRGIDVNKRQSRDSSQAA